jgi:Trp operon repressor
MKSIFIGTSNLGYKLNVHTANSWDKIISLQSINEQEAWQSFFNLLNEFLQRDKNQDIEPMIVNVSSRENIEQVA